MPEPRTCCCHFSDAYECIRSRLGVRFHGDGDMMDDAGEEPCECSCHDKDEDGYTDRDDRSQWPPPGESTP